MHDGGRGGDVSRAEWRQVVGRGRLDTPDAAEKMLRPLIMSGERKKRASRVSGDGQETL